MEAFERISKEAFLFFRRKAVRNGLLNGGFRAEFYRFKRLLAKTSPRFPIPSFKDIYPCLQETTTETVFDPHYVYHLAWAARIVAQLKPGLHIDISSSLYFSTIVSSFLPVQFYDYRPASIGLDNFSSGFADLVSLPFQASSVQSLSCMHVIEHLGLGRYGDPMDPDADLKAISELQRVIAQGGFLLYVVPVGKPRIMFNAHRIYSYEQVLQAFAGFDLKEFSLVPDDGRNVGLIRGATKAQADQQTYGCGCFLFRKPDSSPEAQRVLDAPFCIARPVRTC